MSYKVIPIPRELAEKVRDDLISPQYNHPATVETATGYGPCRACLKTFEVGVEERILFTYNSFEGLADLPLPGPIFIHKNRCFGYSEPGFPKDLIDLPMLFEAFGEKSELLKREPVDIRSIDEQIQKLQNLPNVVHINIRNAEAGCFIARIDA